MKTTFYATFGQGHPHRNFYCIVHADSEAAAQALMTERFGRQWSRLYPTKADAGVDEFGLSLLDTLTDAAGKAM